MKRFFMTLNAGLTLFTLPALYCMEQDENAKKLALFFEIKPVYSKGQPEYESFRNRTYDDIYEPRPALSRDEIVAIAAARAKASAPRKSTSMASKTPEQTTEGNKTQTETK